MKATLSFELPEESVEHLDALHGWEWKAVVLTLCEQLKLYAKHGHNFQDADACIDELRTILHAAIEDRGLFLA